MERIVHKFKSHAEADRAEQRAYDDLTPAARLEMIEILRRRNGQITHDPQRRLQRVFQIIKRP